MSENQRIIFVGRFQEGYIANLATSAGTGTILRLFSPQE
jgi:hypothetical protein